MLLKAFSVLQGTQECYNTFAVTVMLQSSNKLVRIHIKSSQFIAYPVSFLRRKHICKTLMNISFHVLLNNTAKIDHNVTHGNLWIC